MVVGRCLECRTDNPFQNLTAYFTVGKVAVGTPLFQYFIKFHLQYLYISETYLFFRGKGSVYYCFVFA